MENENHFGEWLKRRRRQLDLTQQQLADCAACSVVTIRKFETGERRPSRDLAQLLANCLTIPVDEQETFIAFARNLQTTFASAVPEENPTPTSALLGADPSTPLTASPYPHTPSPLLSMPLPATPFVGRDEELAQIAARLADPACRLLTLVGPGGMGKTRLALAAAAGQTAHFLDGVVFVSLTAVTDPALLPQTIAHSLNVPLTGAEKPAVQLGRILHNRRLLLVLDNFEQLLDGADLLAEWLREAPATKWLVTSRERLNLIEEWLLPVQGFGQADAGVTLFVQSARRVQPDFLLDGQETAVAHICQYVGEMPLAIELAAGWTAVLSCEQILTQMQQTFDFLSTSLRNVPQRHRSLRHLFDQTWQLLSLPEQTVLMKLTVFRGGFALHEAEAVAGATLPLLLALTSKSLLIANGQGRYDLHELVRQYGAEKLRESGLETAVCQQHLNAFVTLAQTAEPQLYGPDAIAWFKRLEDEMDNFRAALDWGIACGKLEAVLAMVNHLWWFWFRRGYWREAETILSASLASAESTDNPLRCCAMLNLSTTRAMQGRFGEAAPDLLEALAMARRLNDAELLVATLIVLGQAVSDTAEAMQIFQEAQTIWAQNGKLHKPWVLARLYTVMGNRMQDNGSYPEAADYYQRSLALYREMGNVDHIAYPLGSMGRLALRENRLREAYQMINESVALSRAIGHQHGLSDWLIYFARTSLYLGNLPEAENALKEAQKLTFETNNPRSMAHTLAYLALLSLVQGKSAAALQYVQESLTIYRKVWQQSVKADALLSSTVSRIVPDQVDCLFITGLVAVDQKQYERATKLFATARRQQQNMGSEPDPSLQEKIVQALSLVQEQLPAATYETLGQLAQEWSIGEVFHFALT